MSEELFNKVLNTFHRDDIDLLLENNYIKKSGLYSQDVSLYWVEKTFAIDDMTVNKGELLEIRKEY